MTSEVTSSKQATNSPGLVKQLFHGDVGLATTFWGYFILLPIVFVMAIGFSSMELLDILYETADVQILVMLLIPSVILLVLLMISYDIFMMIAVWRSATKYVGNKLWAVLAKIYVLKEIIFIPFILFNWMVSDFDYMFQQEVKSIAAELPKRIDENLIITNLELNGKILLAEYSLPNYVLNVQTDDIAGWHDDIYHEKLNDFCDKSSFEYPFLKRGGSIQYKYVDSEEKLITFIIINHKDCMEELH